MSLSQWFDWNITKLILLMFYRIITLPLLTIMLRYLARFRKRFLEQIEYNISIIYVLDQIRCGFGEIFITIIHWFILPPPKFIQFGELVYPQSMAPWLCDIVIFKRSLYCMYMHIDPIFIWYSSSWNEMTDRLTEHTVQLWCIMLSITVFNHAQRQISPNTQKNMVTYK